MICTPRRDIDYVARAFLKELWPVFVLVPWLVAMDPTLKGGWPFLAIIGVVTAVSVSKLYRNLVETRYEVTDDEFMVRTASTCARIPLDCIDEMRPDRLRPHEKRGVFVWSRSVVRVSYHLRPWIGDFLLISPPDPQALFAEVATRCPLLVHDGATVLRREPFAAPVFRSPTATAQVPDAPLGEAVRYEPARDFLFTCESAYVPAVMVGLWIVLMSSGRNAGKSEWWDTVLFAALAGFVGYRAWCLAATSYMLTGSHLVARYGPHVKAIPPAAIFDVYPDWTIATKEDRKARFAWAYDALRIKYAEHDQLAYVLIAPRYRARFLDDLQALCPHLARQGEALFPVDRANTLPPEGTAPRNCGPAPPP